MLFVLSLILLALAVYRLKAGRWGLLAFLLSPPAVAALMTGNLDALVLFGATLPPAWGLLLVSVKPQIGAPLAVFWLVETWRAGGWRNTIRVFAPIAILCLISFAMFGLWPLRMFQPAGYAWNASLWPWSVPVGLGLLAWSLKRRQEHPSLAAGPFLSPYLSFQSYSACLLALVGRPRWLWVASAGLWALVIFSL